MSIILASLSGFLFISLTIYAVFLFVTKEKRQIDERMQRVSTSLTKALPEEGGDKPHTLSLKTLIGKAGGVFARRGMTKGIEEQLTKADIPLRGEEFLIIWILLALGPGTLLYITSSNVILAFVLYLMGILLPPILLNIARQKRLKKFNLLLGESLSIMANALRAGFSFMQCLEMVSREMPNPLAKEFARTYREMNLGTPTEQALQNMVKRVASDDLDLLVTAVLIQRQVGGNLAEVLDNISNTIRERIRIQGEIKTLTAQGRLTGIIIGLLPVALLLLLLIVNPTYMEPLISSKVGWALLATGVINECIGLIIINKIISIDV